MSRITWDRVLAAVSAIAAIVKEIEDVATSLTTQGKPQNVVAAEVTDHATKLTAAHAELADAVTAHEIATSQDVGPVTTTTDQGDGGSGADH